MKNLVLLISGRGSNMQAIARACATRQWPARIVAVVCHREEAEGVALARRLGLRVEIVPVAPGEDRAETDRRLADCLEGLAPDLVVLAGYMRILSAEFVTRYAGRLLNIHPSLLPAFPGLHTHRQALAAGVRVHGATVHFVTPRLDDGPILAQAVVPVLDDDTEERLAARVLEAEHQLYPAALGRWLSGELECVGQRVRLRPAPSPSVSESDQERLLWVR